MILTTGTLYILRGLGSLFSTIVRDVMITCGVRSRIGHGILLPATNEIVYTQLQDPRERELIDVGLDESIVHIKKEEFEAVRENVRKLRSVDFPDPGPFSLFVRSDITTNRFIEMGRAEDILTPQFISSLNLNISVWNWSFIPHHVLQHKTIMSNHMIVNIKKTTIKESLTKLCDWFKKPSIPGLILSITMESEHPMLPLDIFGSVITMTIYTHPSSSKIHYEQLKSHFGWARYKTVGLQDRTLH